MSRVHLCLAFQLRTWQMFALMRRAVSMESHFDAAIIGVGQLAWQPRRCLADSVGKSFSSTMLNDEMLRRPVFICCWGERE
jgi:hypothetical protein